MILGTKWQELKLLWEMELSENYLTFLQIAAYFQCNILMTYLKWCVYFFPTVACLRGKVSNIFYSTVNSFLFLMLTYLFII